MARMRIYGILAGYADQNDHGQLRYDPVFKLLAGRRPSDDELAASRPVAVRRTRSTSLRCGGCEKYSSISSWPLSTSRRDGSRSTSTPSNLSSV